ncbi:hypothetical protein C5S30_04390 [ANME-1 cluster archaeon GoMg4]|nr:hypothetical protein [ANME-1 cluster archaeon GoMg4]
MKTKLIDGVPFILHRTSKKKTTAKYEAEKFRRAGYYVRVLKSSKGYEIWVSMNPRWFYKLDTII